MQQEKEKTISELLALRAGLSVISEYADEVREAEGQIESNRSDIAESREALCEINATINEGQREYDRCRKLYEEEKANYKKTLKTKVWTEMKETGLLGGLLGIPFLLSFFLLVLCGTVIGRQVGAAIGTVSFIAGETVILGIYIAICIIKYKKIKSRETFGLNNSLSALEESLSKAKSMIEQGTKKRDEFIPKKQFADDRLNKQIAEYKSYNKSMTKESDGVYAALKETFSSKLSPADWQNLDLIIFYMTSGRADTIKESLQLVDRQRQTDEIVSAVNRASDSICKEIRNGISALGKTIVTGFNVIGEQISDLSTRLAESHMQTLQSLDDIQKTQSELLSVERLSNALQEKAAVTNVRLVEDLEYMQYRSGLNY